MCRPINKFRFAIVVVLCNEWQHRKVCLIFIHLFFSLFAWLNLHTYFLFLFNEINFLYLPVYFELKWTDKKKTKKKTQNQTKNNLVKNKRNNCFRQQIITGNMTFYLPCVKFNSICLCVNFVLFRWFQLIDRPIVTPVAMRNANFHIKFISSELKQNLCTLIFLIFILNIFSFFFFTKGILILKYINTFLKYAKYINDCKFIICALWMKTFYII